MAQKLENSTVLSEVVATYRVTFLMVWPFCLWTFKKLCLCMANLVLSKRLAVRKPSFLNLLRQNGRRMTKVY